MSYLKTGLRSTVLLMLLGVGASLSGYFTRLLLARNFTPTEFGLFFAIISLILFLRFFTSSGFGTATVKYLAQYRAKQEWEKVRYTILLSFILRLSLVVIIFVAVYFLADWLGSSYFKNALATPLVSIMAWTLFFLAGNLFVASIFRGFQRAHFNGAVDFTRRFLFLLMILSLFWFGIFEITNVAYAFVLSAGITTLIFVIWGLVGIKIPQAKIEYSPTVTKALVFYSISAFLTGFGHNILGQLDTLMLTYFTSLENVGVYNVVLPTAMMLMFFSRSAGPVFFPMVSELWAKGLKEKLSQGLSLIVKYCLLAVAPLSALLLVFPSLVISLLFGNEYVTGAYALMALAFVVPVYTIGMIYQQVLLGAGHPYAVTRGVGYTALINIAGNIMLIPLFDKLFDQAILGAATTTFLSYFLFMIFLWYQTRKRLGVSIDLTPSFRILLATGVFICAAVILKGLISLHPILEASIVASFSGLIYLGTCYFIRAIHYKEIKDLIKTLVSRR